MKTAEETDLGATRIRKRSRGWYEDQYGVHEAHGPARCKEGIDDSRRRDGVREDLAIETVIWDGTSWNGHDAPSSP